MKTLIFDFDGTLADSFEKTVDILHSYSKYTQYNLSKDFIGREIRTKPIKQIIKDFNFSTLHLFFIVLCLRNEFKKNRDSLLLFPDIKEVLNKLYDLGYNLILVTSSTKMTVNHLLKKENLCFFSEIHCKSSLFGKSKIINKLIKKNNLDKEKIYYIGDELRDIYYAKKCGIFCVSVTWGYNSKSLLEQEKPNYIINSPSELLKII